MNTPLKKSGWEHFAHLIAKGEKPDKAYVLAGYSKNGADQSAHKLLKNAEIQERIAQIRANINEIVTEKTALDKAWVLKRLETIVERCMQAAPVLDRKGKQVLVETPDGDMVPAFTFNPMAANKALELIGTELGMFDSKSKDDNATEHHVLAMIRELAQNGGAMPFVYVDEDIQEAEVIEEEAEDPPSPPDATEKKKLTWNAH